MIDQNSNNRYPYYPPFDQDVDFYQEAQLKLDPQCQHKMIKFCPICNIPIHIRIVSHPCNHYFCYACYQKNKFECGYCGSLNSKVERIQDKATIFSCDNQCYKIFQTQQKLQKHMRDHQLLRKN